jgi:hypothetical protein
VSCIGCSMTANELKARHQIDRYCPACRERWWQSVDEEAERWTYFLRALSLLVEHGDLPWKESVEQPQERRGRLPRRTARTLARRRSRETPNRQIH